MRENTAIYRSSQLKLFLENYTKIDENNHRKELDFKDAELAKTSELLVSERARLTELEARVQVDKETQFGIWKILMDYYSSIV